MQKYIFLLLSVISIFSFAQPAKKTTKSKTAKKTVRAKMPKDVQVWTIDAQRAKCEGVTTMQCLLVKKQFDKDFNLFYKRGYGWYIKHIKENETYFLGKNYNIIRRDFDKALFAWQVFGGNRELNIKKVD